eukprot:1667458-Rhodomonas_salina.1
MNLAAEKALNCELDVEASECDVLSDARNEGQPSVCKVRTVLKLACKLDRVGRCCRRGARVADGMRCLGHRMVEAFLLLAQVAPRTDPDDQPVPEDHDGKGFRQNHVDTKEVISNLNLRSKLRVYELYCGAGNVVGDPAGLSAGIEGEAHHRYPRPLCSCCARVVVVGFRTAPAHTRALLPCSIILRTLSTQ